ncbi:hypothetical protein AURDEDRAFT_177582 [Auricularia subglabra TFB-10046 SS5]|uniref:F-box domain-containing protein n=1 Tax=Auricularia subglabra (strain TFB-10046 / SS5) TaxID=717982 RepID=J0CST0_AURST|nr:hypothetical protein AURDEDRAFT_177582 [Auricularia subglabra TFB-10046 SS5]
MGTLAGLLRRAGNSPVDVHVTHISFLDLHEVVRILGDHIYHIRTLALYTSAPKLDDFHMPLVCTIFEKPAPLLEVVDIQLFEVSIAEESRHLDSLQDASLRLPPQSLRQAPKLRQLSFRTMTFPQAAVDCFLAVTRMELDGVSLSADQMSAIVSLPCLRSLHLEIGGCALPNTRPPPTFRLDELWLFGLWDNQTTNPDLFGSVLRYLGFPRIRHLTTANQQLLDIASPPSFDPLILLVDDWVCRNDCNGEIGVAWRLVDHRGFLFDFVEIISLSAPYNLDTRVLVNLIEIEIPYHELVTYTRDLALPQLKRLCLRVRAPDTARWTSERSREDNIRCPSLYTLELWSYPEQSTISIQAAQLLHLITGYLTLAPHRPADVVLRGTTVVYRSQLDLLNPAVATIRDGDGPAPPPFVLELQSKWHASVP